MLNQEQTKNPYIPQREKETKRQRDKGSKGQRDKETKSQRDKETKGQRDKETKRQRVKEGMELVKNCNESIDRVEKEVV